MWLKAMAVCSLSNHCAYVCIFSVSTMFFRPADVSRPVCEILSPLFLSLPTPSFAYISAINPVLGGLLWSLCVLWAMVIICLLCSHSFMMLVCFLPLLPVLSLSHYIFVTLTLSVNLNVHVQSLSFAYYSTALPFFLFFLIFPPLHQFHLLSFAACYRVFTLKLPLLHRFKRKIISN